MPSQTHLDGKPSNLIRCSHGGENDPRMFYATTYCTTHHARNAVVNESSERKLNTQFRWDKKAHEQAIGLDALTFARRPIVQAAGYQRNLLPYFEYDKQVDEAGCFQDPDHYATIQAKSFRNPSDLPARAKKGAVVIAGVPDVQKYEPVHSEAHFKNDAAWHEFESTMKASYRKNEMFPCIAAQDATITGRDHESGWVRNRMHDKGGLYNPLVPRHPNARKQKTDAPKPTESPYHVTSFGSTSYSRPDAAIPEIDTAHLHDVPPFRVAQLKSQNPLEYNFFSKNPHNTIPAPVITGHGAKEVTSGCKEEHVTDVLSRMQHRSWDSTYSASYDPIFLREKTSTGAQGCINRTSNRSGYSMCNKYEFEAFDSNSPLSQGGQTATSDEMLRAARARQEFSMQQRV